MQKVLTLTIALICCISAMSDGNADMLILKNGQRIDCLIQSEDNKFIVFQTSGGELQLHKDQIAKIERQSVVTNTLHKATFQLRRSQTNNAIQYIEEAIELGAEDMQIRDWFLYNQPRLSLMLKKMLPREREPWRTYSTKVVDVEPPTVQVLINDSSTSFTLAPLFSAPPKANLRNTTKEEQLYLLEFAELWNTLDEKDLAVKFLDQLSTETLRANKTNRPFIKETLTFNILKNLRVGDLQQAAAAINTLQAAGYEQNAKAHRMLLILRADTIERKSGNYDAALNLLYQQLLPVSPTLAHERMAATLDLGLKEMINSKKFSDALKLLNRWAKKSNTRNPQLVEATILEKWGQALLKEKKPKRARDKFMLAFQLDPKRDTSILKHCDFEIRMLELSPTDYAGAYKTGQWAIEQGLISDAIRAFEHARKYSALYAAAEKQIFLLYDQIANDYFQRCLEHFENGDPEKTLEELNKMPAIPSTDRLGPRIRRLRSLCYQEINRRITNDVVQAEILYQNSERDYYLAETLQQRIAAISDMKHLREIYPGTPIIKRVNYFIRQAQTQIRLEERIGTSTTDNNITRPVESSPQLEREVLQLLNELE